MRSRSTRAKPLPPADRRRAILDAAVPLLIQKGGQVTTAEVAAAAQIAEGTLFRVFPDKPALIFEAVQAVMDPSALVLAIRGIAADLPLPARLEQAAGLLCDYFNRITALGESLRATAPPGAGPPRDMRRLVRDSTAPISVALTELLAPHAAQLRVPPATAVAALRGLVFASAHPLLPPAERLPVGEVVGILLSGIAPATAR